MIEIEAFPCRHLTVLNGINGYGNYMVVPEKVSFTQYFHAFVWEHFSAHHIGCAVGQSEDSRVSFLWMIHLLDGKWYKEIK